MRALCAQLFLPCCCGRIGSNLSSGTGPALRRMTLTLPTNIQFSWVAHSHHHAGRLGQDEMSPVRSMKLDHAHDQARVQGVISLYKDREVAGFTSHRRLLHDGLNGGWTSTVL